MRVVQDHVLLVGRLLQLHRGAGEVRRERGASEGLQEDLLFAALPRVVQQVRAEPTCAQVPVHVGRVALDVAEAADARRQLQAVVEAGKAPVEPHNVAPDKDGRGLRAVAGQQLRGLVAEEEAD